MRKNRSVLFALFAIAILAIAACAPAPAAAPGASEGEVVESMEPVVLNLNAGTEPPSLDPSIATDTTSINILNETHLALTELDPDTQEATPMLATSWDISDDGTIWTFHMRDDVPWVGYDVDSGEVVEITDGNGDVRIVNAHDVVYGVKRTCNALTASDYSYVLYVIDGCEAANTAEDVTDDLLDGIRVEAIDDFTVEFTLGFGASYFGQIASMWVARPMPQWAIEEHGDLWTEPENFQANGPYVVSEWIHGDTLQMVRNPFWYGWEEMSDIVGNIDVIDWIMIEEQSTSFALYESNELDWAAIPLEQMDRVSDPEGEFAGQYVNLARNCTYYYGFVTEKPAVSDVRVRRALSMGIDRQTLSDAVLKGGQIPANTFTNPLNFGSPAGDTDIAPWTLTEDMGGTGYAAAVEMGQALLEEAGYPNGDGLSITLAHNTSESHAKIAQAIQAMWSEAYPGIEVIVENQEWGVYLDSLDKDAPLENKPDVYRLGWCQDYPHANNWIHEVFNPTQGGNEPLVSFDDPQVGDAVQRFNDATIAAQTASVDEQLELYKEAERLYIDEIAGIAPIYYYTRVGAAKPWLDRVYSDALYLYRWSIDAEAKAAAQ